MKKACSLPTKAVKAYAGAWDKQAERSMRRRQSPCQIVVDPLWAAMCGRGAQAMGLHLLAWFRQTWWKFVAWQRVRSAGPQHRRAGLLTSLYLLSIKKETMQGGCSSSTSSLLLSLTGLALSTACVAQAMQPGRIGTLHATIGAVCSSMLSSVMPQGCAVVLMPLFVRYACVGMQNIARSWSKLAKEDQFDARWTQFLVVGLLF
jgi:hypothetical protein